MSEIQLPHGRATVVDNEDFESLVSYRWSVGGDGYVHRTGRKSDVS